MKLELNLKQRIGPMTDMSRIPLIYVAGPYRAVTPWLVEQNVRRAEEVGLQLAKAGAMPVVPHVLTRFYSGECGEQFWEDATLALLLRCDGVVLLPQWHRSVGAGNEKHEAERAGIPTVVAPENVTISQLYSWLDVSVRPYMTERTEKGWT